MPERSPRVLAITTVGCLMVVALLAAGALSDSIIITGLAFVATLVTAGLLLEMTLFATSGPAGGGQVEDRPPNPGPREAPVR